MPLAMTLQLERDIDCLAAQAVALIEAENDDHRVEYGYFIIRDSDGELRLSERQTSGEPNRINFGGDGRLSLSETEAARWSDVLGFVHNHPNQRSGSVSDRVTDENNERPSDDDWAILDHIVAQSGGQDMFRLYIREGGPAGSGLTRQYDSSDNRQRTSDDIVSPMCSGPGGH